MISYSFKLCIYYHLSWQENNDQWIKMCFKPEGHGSLWHAFNNVQLRPSPEKPEGHEPHWAPSTVS